MCHLQAGSSTSLVGPFFPSSFALCLLYPLLILSFYKGTAAPQSSALGILALPALVLLSRCFYSYQLSPIVFLVAPGT